MISGFEPGVNAVCSLLGFYAALIGSFMPTFRDNGGGEVLTAVWVKIQVIGDVSPCLLVNLPSSPGPTVQDECTTFHRNVCNPTPLISTSVRTSCRQAELLRMTRLLRICEDHFRIHKSPILDMFFIWCIMIC